MKYLPQDLKQHSINQYLIDIHIFIAFVCQLVFMVAAGYIMKPVAACVCLTLAVGLGGFAWAGFSVNHLDIAPQVKDQGLKIDLH